MNIDNELIAYLEELSRLQLDPGEKEASKRNLGEVLGYIDKLSELDTGGVEGVSHPFSFANAFREDVVGVSYPQEEILRNAPEQRDGCFMVPKTVE